MSPDNEILKQIFHMKALKIDKIVCVFDQALYAKATERI